jgi:D-alanyl-D-alanine dipeptidase
VLSFAGHEDGRVPCSRRERRVFATFIIAFFAILPLYFPASFAQSASIPREFVYLRDIDPTIIQDMRYAGADNFTGAPVPGYSAPECIVLRAAAEALKRVQAELARNNLSLKVYDCYRPQRAVRAFVHWAYDGKPDGSTRRFYPRLRKSELFARGYIASVSRHSSGNTIDLTLVELPAREQPAFDPGAHYGSCIASREQRAPDNSVDMGTGFDCFDVRSHTYDDEIPPEQRRWRRTLLTTMQRHGFRNYAREWWHFTYGMAGAGGYDFIVVPR